MTIHKGDLYIILTPLPNKKLTNGEIVAEYDVSLGVGDKPENWYEIDDETKEDEQ